MYIDVDYKDHLLKLCDNLDIKFKFKEVYWHRNHNGVQIQCTQKPQIDTAQKGTRKKLASLYKADP